MTARFLTEEEKAELRKIASPPIDRNPFIGMANSDMALYEQCLDTPMFAFHFNRAAVECREADEKLRPTVLALLDEIEAHGKTIARLKAALHEWEEMAEFSGLRIGPQAAREDIAALRADLTTLRADAEKESK